MKRKMVEAPCPNCGTSVILRLPKGAQEGDFSVNCQDCDEIIDLEITVTPSGRDRIRINGRLLRPHKTHLEPVILKETRKSSKVKIEEDKEEKWGPDYHRRITIAFWILIVVGILGIASSIATVTSSFTIKDLEEQSPNDTVTFSLWVFDSETGRSIEGAEVLLHSEGYRLNGTSNNQGLIVIKNVRSGEMEMEISCDDHKTSTGTIWISKGTPNVLDVPMEKGAPSETVEAPITTLESKRYSPGLTNITAVIMFLASIMAFVAAFFMRARDFFTLTVISAFLSIFSFGFLIGSILALIVLIILINSYKGFSHHYELRMILEEQGREDLKNFFTSQISSPPQLPPAK
jgi:hypothetical protein